MRLDEEKLEALRSWGERLREAGGEESAAVGRAILILVEEIDRLHIELWHARMRPSAGEPVAPDEAVEDGKEAVSSLHTRLQRVLQREGPAEPVEPGDPVEQSSADAENDRTSQRARIAALRRQK